MRSALEHARRGEPIPDDEWAAMLADAQAEVRARRAGRIYARGPVGISPQTAGKRWCPQCLAWVEPDHRG